MKRTIIILLSMFATVCFAQQRYYHETGLAILRVDESYPGALVEHRYNYTGYDNLFRAFLAIGNEDGEIAYGSAHEYDPLYTGTFTIYEPHTGADLSDTFQVYEFFDTTYTPIIAVDTTYDTTFIDTTFTIDTNFTTDTIGTDTTFTLTKSESFIYYEDTTLGILVCQHVTAEMDSGADITVEFVLENTGDESLFNLRTLLFYDGDVPDSGYLNDYPNGIDYLDAVAVRDSLSSVFSGFCGLLPDSGMMLGAWRNWVDSLAEPDMSQMDSLVYSTPGWPDSSEADSAGDWSVFGLWLLPDIAPGESETIRVAFIVGQTADFESIAAEVRGDSIAPFVAESPRPEELWLTIAPNPFNSSCRISLVGSGAFQSPAQEADIEIFDLSGRLVQRINLQKGSQNAIWDGKDVSGRELSSGIYLVRTVIEGQRAIGAKVILLR